MIKKALKLPKNLNKTNEFLSSNRNSPNLFATIADKLLHLQDHWTTTIEAHPATRITDIDFSFRLIYQNFSAHAQCSLNDSEKFYYFHSFLPKSRLFVLKKNEVVRGTISLIPDSHVGLPMEAFLYEELTQMRSNNAVLAQISLLTLDPLLFENKIPHIYDNSRNKTYLLHLYKAVFDYATTQTTITDFVVMIDPKLQKIYEELGMKPIGEVHSCGDALKIPLQAMHLNIAEIMKDSSKNKHYDFFTKSTASQETLTTSYKWQPEDIVFYLTEVLPLWKELKPHERGYIKQCYPKLNQYLILNEDF